MSAEFESGFTVGRAWHGLSDVVSESLTTEEAFRRSGLLWNVEKADLIVRVPAGWDSAKGETLYQHQPLNDYRAIYRDSDNSILGVVGADFSVIQNREMFDFLDVLVAGENKVAKFHSAGSLRDGKRVWCLLDVPGSEIVIEGTNDRTAPYIFVGMGHDGGMALQANACGTRVVCANTFRIAKNEGKESRVVVRHSGDTKSKIAVAQLVFAEATGAFKSFARVANELAAITAPRDALEGLVNALWPVTGDETDRQKANRDEKILLLTQGVQEEFKLLPQYAGSQPTYWHLFNGLTRFADHKQKVQVRGRDIPEVRFESNLLGTSDTLKQRGAAFLFKEAGVAL